MRAKSFSLSTPGTEIPNFSLLASVVGGWPKYRFGWKKTPICVCFWLLKRVDHQVVEDFEGRVKMDFPKPQKSTVCPHPTPISVWFLSDMSRHSATVGFCLCSTSYTHTFFAVRGGVKESVFFLLSVKRGGLSQSKKSLSENTQIFCDHFGLKTEFFYHFFHLGG